jgi:hypothetical protein
MRDLIPLRRHNLLFFPLLSRVKIIGGKKIPHFGAAVKSSGFLSPGSDLTHEPEESSEKLCIGRLGGKLQ